MTNNRSRGRWAELQVAKRYGGRRISATGMPGNDVLIKGREYEVKIVKKLPALLLMWIAQVIGQDGAGVIFRGDRMPWWIMVPADEYFGLTDYAGPTDE